MNFFWGASEVTRKDSFSLPLLGRISFQVPIKVIAESYKKECQEKNLPFGSNGRSPEVSSSAFSAQPPNLQPVSLMDTDFAVSCPLVRHCMPQIRFLYIGSRLCSTLLSDATSRLRLCASLSLHVHHVVKRICTS